MTATTPSPERILQLVNGYWATAVIGVAAEHRVFTHLHDGARTVEDIAGRAAISGRGAQALLDGLVSIGLVHVEHGTYRNTAEADTYLIEDTPLSLSGFARLKPKHMGGLATLSDVVRAGAPLERAVVEVSDNPHWEEIVQAIAAQSVPAARLTVDLLGLRAAGPISVLDIGGGSGIYSATWLEANPQARATQLDWASINAIARRLLDDRGLGDRFDCIDGDFHDTDFGVESYDVAVYSNIAHQEGPAENTLVFARVRDALRPGGALVICDYVVDDDRAGPSFPLIFANEMLLKSRHGSTWRRSDYQEWLTAAGFDDISFHRAPPATVIVARNRATTEEQR